MRRDETLFWIVLAGIVVMAIAIVVMSILEDGDAREECAKRGGRVLKVRGPAKGGWVCLEEKRP